ncbi:mas-related G-protein coupled receptor member H-like isoform X2 [Motacilla alba alba]|uniref:mas-related G-protein coupled receptor member H-like isoform X2 n=1 Tax=Motacilla alba alba TaxID=1094192 RepID=UPI0018D54E75|nr:mas-related G-protein coupled receptor member H-like isoform X2 [Motacilla alba alba]
MERRAVPADGHQHREVQDQPLPSWALLPLSPGPLMGGGAALGHGSQRSKRHQEAPLICTDPFACCCPTGNRSRFRTWIPKEQEAPGSAADLHRPLCLLLPHREQGAAEEPHGPSLGSPSTDCPSTLTTARGHIPLPAQRPSMDVTTVSPSPPPPPTTSPSEGDDLCEIHVTDVAIHSVTLLICLCGLAGNGAVIWVLGFPVQRDAMKPITAYILDLAIINFLFLIFMVPSPLLLLLEDFSCSSIMSPAYTGFLFLLFVMFYSVGLFRLTAISIERCRTSLSPRGLFCHFPQGLSWGVVSAGLWALSITVIAAISAVTSLCESQGHKHCQWALICLYIPSFLIFAPSVVISSTILFIHFKGRSQLQQFKKLDIIVFFAVLFTLPLSLWNFLQQLGYTTVFPQLLLLFASMHSSINPFIYISVTKCWRRCSMESLREHLQKVFEEPEESSAPSNDATRDTGV